MIQFNDIGVHDVVEFKQDVQVLSSRMIVLSRVDSIEDKREYVLSLAPVGCNHVKPTLLFMPRQADIISNVIRQQAVPVVIEALKRLEMTAGQPAMYDDPVRVHARAALRAVRGEETK